MSQISLGDKLYVIVRSDMEFGAQASQISHSAIEFCFRHPEITKDWFINSNYICLLQVKNEEELIKLINKAEEKEIKYSIFKESDLNDSITSICLEPGIKTKKIVSSLKLAFK